MHGILISSYYIHKYGMWCLLMPTAALTSLADVPHGCHVF